MALKMIKTKIDISGIKNKLGQTIVNGSIGDSSDRGILGRKVGLKIGVFKIQDFQFFLYAKSLFCKSFRKKLTFKLNLFSSSSKINCESQISSPFKIINGRRPCLDRLIKFVKHG